MKPGDQGFVRTDIRFSHEYVTPMAAIFFDELVGRDEPVNDPSSVFLFRDHLTFLDQVMRPEHVQMGLLDVANQLEKTQREFAAAKGIKLYGQLDQREPDARCRRRAPSDCPRVLEAHACRGDHHLSDSHHRIGAVGCVAFGVGTTRSSTVITKDLRVEVPRVRSSYRRGEPKTHGEDVMPRSASST